MKKVRKGNDIAVSWSIVHEEQDFDLTSLDTTLYLINIFGKQEVKDYKKEGNRISWTFHGKDQKNTGKYSLMLVLNEGSINMHTIDACDFVELTSCSCQISEGSDNNNVTTEVIELSSVIDYLVVDDQLDADSANPISNAAVTKAINAVGERILDIAVFELHSPSLMQEAFEKYNLATNLNVPISCLVKYNSTDTEYQSVFLVVEKYGNDYKLSFIKLNACTKAITDENGEIDEEKTKWSARGQLIDGICDVYLLKPGGYCISVGTGTLLLADDKLDSESDRPISNKAICEALNNVKLFEVVSSLPAQGDNNKVYLVASISGETENLLTEYIWVNGKWEKLGEFKADVDLSKYAKKSEVGFVKDVNDNIINDTSNSAAVGKKNIIIGGSAFIQGDRNIAIGVNGNIRSKNSILIGSAPSDNDDKLVIGSEGLGELLVIDENNKAYLRGFGYNGNRNGGESSIDNEYRRLIAEIEKKVSADNLATINGQSLTEGGNIVIEGSSATPDWNANKGAEGYIKNRTHFFNPTVTVSASAWTFDNSGEPKKATATLNIDWLYRFEWQDNTYYIKTDNTEDFVKGVMNDGSIRVNHICVGGQHSLEFSRYGTAFTEAPTEVRGTTINAATSLGFLKKLDDMFIPETIARKSELTELSEEVSGLSERVDDLEQGGQGSSDIFKAEYGVTTYEEVSEAYNQGKIIHCDYENRCYELAVFTANIAWFSCLNTTTSFLLTLNAESSWSKASYGLENIGNKVDTIQADAKPYQYPSAKAVYEALQNVGGGGEDTWQVLELNTADIPEDRILLDVGADKYITDVDIDLAFSTNALITEEKEFRLGFLNTTGFGYGNVIRQNLNINNAISISAKYIGECVNVKNVKVSRMRSGWCGLSTNAINEQGGGGGWSVSNATGSMYASVSEMQNRRYLQIYNYFSKDTLVFAWVRIKYKTANV